MFALISRCRLEAELHHITLLCDNLNMEEKKAAIYLRISLDQTGEGLAVERQKQDCLAIAEAKGYEIVEIYSDSVSAFKKNVRRPNYDRMVSDYLEGKFNVVICWDLDRLTRQDRQLLDWIDWAEERGLHLITANGEADLSNDNGRMFAKMKVMVARAEMERKSARQKRALQQRAEMGRPPKGTRLTGYTINGVIEPAEAKVVEEIFTLFSVGETLKGLGHKLNAEGVPSRNGKGWDSSTIRGILTNARYCGRSVYKGQNTGIKGNWEPIVTEALFDFVQIKLSDPSRKKNGDGTARKHLGSGLFRCAVCGGKLRTSGTRYWCPQGGHVLRTQEFIDEFVMALVIERLNEPDLTGRMLQSKDTEQAEVEAAMQNLYARLKTVESDYDAGFIDGRRFKTASDSINSELTAMQLDRAKRAAGQAVAAAVGSQDPGLYFMEGSLATKRAILDALVTISVKHQGKGVKGFKGESLEWVWKTQI